jgi:hypothetical protein
MRGVKRIKLRRSKMWRDDPHCRRCRILTVLPEDVDVKALREGGTERPPRDHRPRGHKVRRRAAAQPGTR